MNKEQQIEEMAKVIDDRLIEARVWLGSMNRGKGYWIAQKLVENYQPKLPEYSVVLSREEYDEIKIYKSYIPEMKKAFDKVRNAAIKETAEKILDLLVPDCKACDENWHSGCLCLRATLAEKIAKQFGVEVEE